MWIIYLAIVGAAAGFVATQIMKFETGPMQTIAIGIGGAIIGGVLFRVLLALTGWAAGFIGAILGAMLLIWLWKRFGQDRR